MLTTFSDLLDHALAYLGGDTARANSDKARRAVVAAYKELAARHPWSWYRAGGRVVTVAQYSTGTVAFDYTGGAAERLVTLTGGTFPAWAASGTIVIGDVPYEVSTRESSTTLTLGTAQNPGEDVAAGTAYTLYQDAYAIPSDCRTLDEVTIDTVGQSLQYRHPGEWATFRRRNSGPGKPLLFGLAGAGTAAGGMNMLLWPPPDARYELDFLYQRTPRAMLLDRREAGLVTISAASAAVAGTNTAFTAAMVGSVIRVADNTTDPVTGPEGDNPPAEERVISAVASATTLTVSEAFTAGYTAAKYVVTDPADVDDVVAGRYLLREVERQCRIAARMEMTRAEMQEYTNSLKEAQAADSRYSGPRAAGAGGLARYRLRDYRAGTEFE